MIEFFFGWALIIIVLALPYFVLAMIGVGMIAGAVLLARGAFRVRLPLILTGLTLVVACGAAALAIRSWSTTCPPEGAMPSNPHRFVYELAMHMRNRAFAMEAIRKGTVIGLKLGSNPCSKGSARRG